MSLCHEIQSRGRAVVALAVRLDGPHDPKDGHEGCRLAGGDVELIGHLSGREDEIVLAIVGGLFVLEAISVIVQVVSFKLTGKRVFKMAPIHHHFEQLGWTEPQIVIRFWIVAVVLALAGLATLKLR